MIELLEFSHDRDADFRQSCRNLLETIDAFVEQAVLDGWYDYFEASYSLPRNIVKQQMKAYLSRSYDYRRCMFFENFFQKERFKSAAIHAAILSYVLYFSKHYPGSVNAYDLIIHCIPAKDPSRLIDLFGKQNVLSIAQIDMHKPEEEILYRPEYKFYDRNEVTRTLFQEAKNGLRLYLNLSKKTKVNLLPIASYIIKQYLYAYSIFKHNRSKYYIEQKQYETSAVRNHIFHKFGGTYSCCTQINIQQLGVNGFYYDTDVFFSLGNKSAEWVFNCGARINHIVPVGSTAMEYRYFGNKVKRTQAQKYDIVYITNCNTTVFRYLDGYTSFMDDYYDSFKWLADFSIQNPGLRIGIKDGPQRIISERERKIINDTPIEYIDKTLNSYEVAFQAKCAIAYGSTMGYELLGNGLPVLYLAPGMRSMFLPVENGAYLEPYRVSSYEEFCQKLTILLSGQLLEGMEHTDKTDFCLDSSSTSERIYSWLLSERKNK
jgi:hypothetical protein